MGSCPPPLKLNDLLMNQPNKPETGEYLAKMLLTGGAIGLVGAAVGISTTVLVPFGMAAWYLVDKNERKPKE